LIKNFNSGRILLMEGIHRSQKDRIIFGVCGGLAEYFDISPFSLESCFLDFRSIQVIFH